MEDTAGNPKKVLLDRFPLTSRKQHMPYALQYHSIFDRWTTAPFVSYIRQVLLDLVPHLARDLVRTRICWFRVNLFQKVHPVLNVIGYKIYHEVRSLIDLQDF